MEFVSFRLQVLMEHQLEKQVEVFTLMFSLTTGIIKKLLSIAQKKKRKGMIRFLCWLKVNSIALISQALIDMEISHEEFNAIIREKQKYERMKEKLKNASEKQENMR